MAIQYKTETGVTVARLEELDNTEGWQLKQVLHSWSGDTVYMVVLLYKSLPDTVVMMTPPAKRRPGRPKREAA